MINENIFDKFLDAMEVEPYEDAIGVLALVVGHLSSYHEIDHLHITKDIDEEVVAYENDATEMLKMLGDIIA